MMVLPIGEGTTMTRDEMLKVIGDGYIARVNGDVDKVLAAFTPDATFTLNAAPQQPTVSVAAEGSGGMRAALKQLIYAFAFEKLDIVDSVIEGSKAAIRTRFTVTCRATGQTAVTEALDLIEFRDGKVASYTQFFDTAVADRLACKA
jgi:ketosteroid isomerase-like protein